MGTPTFSSFNDVVRELEDVYGHQELWLYSGLNIVSVITDGVVLFATSSVFWLAVAGWLVILTPVILRRKFSAKKKVNRNYE